MKVDATSGTSRERPDLASPVRMPDAAISPKIASWMRLFCREIGDQAVRSYFSCWRAGWTRWCSRARWKRQ